MKRTIFGVVTVLLALGLVLVGCAGPADPLSDLARGAKKDGNGIVWNDSDKLVAATIIPYLSNKKNASGDKITSNAHSNDYPEIYFCWDKKQKDGGYLKVAASFFEDYEGFNLIKKVSNTYWEYPISIQTDQEMTADNCYVFEVPKGGKYYTYDKTEGETYGKVENWDNSDDFNINMVFIGDKKLKGVPFIDISGDPQIDKKFIITFEKKVYDANGNLLDYADWADDAEFFVFDLYDGDAVIATKKLDGGPIVTFEVAKDGSYEVKERIEGGRYEEAGVISVAPAVQEKSITIISKKSDGGAVVVDDTVRGYAGGDIKAYWNARMQGDFDSLTALGATWIWDRSDSWEYGLSGSAVIHWTTAFDLDEAEFASLPAEIPLWFACDNAAVLFVNEQRVAYTAALEGFNVPEWGQLFKTLNDAEGFGSLEQHWSVISRADIAPYLVAGSNQIVFYAANSDECDETYDKTNNPCGLIFSTQINVSKSIGDGETYEFANVQLPKKVLGDSYSSITGTNGPFVVPNSNHFTYAKLDRADLVDGVTLDMVVGNKIEKVGEAFVQLVDGKIEITLDGEGSFGAVASATLWNPGNGNVHSGQGDKNFSHNNVNVIDCPAGDVIYLYIHTENFAFYKYL